jgi:hypothetical protein
MNENMINNFKKIQEKYSSNINLINNNLKKKFFNPDFTKLSKFNKESIKISSYDDMYEQLYFKQRYFNYDIMSSINLEYPNSNNILKDICFLLKKINIKFIHDDKFKICKFATESNFFNPKDEKEIILYNSIDKNTFQQTEFRKQLWHIEDVIKNYYSKIYNESIEITFYDDKKYDMIWIIVKINPNDQINDEVFGFEKN